MSLFVFCYVLRASSKQRLSLRAKLELLTKPHKNMKLIKISTIRIRPDKKAQKKNAYWRHLRHFTIRFRFNAVADKRQCSWAASKPLRNSALNYDGLFVLQSFLHTRFGVGVTPLGDVYFRLCCDFALPLPQIDSPADGG